VEDGGTPRLNDRVVLELFVTKNFRTPQFTNVTGDTITKTIQESAPVGLTVLRLTAEDLDVLVGARDEM